MLLLFALSEDVPMPVFTHGSIAPDTSVMSIKLRVSISINKINYF